MKKSLYFVNWRFWLVCLGACFLTLTLTDAVSASTTGKIAGIVKDGSTGESLPTAQILITEMIVEGIEIDISEPMGAVSNLKGEY